jgi:hypothetical protein
MMGGDVTMTSEMGKGSVFTVRLPGGGHRRKTDSDPICGISAPTAHRSVLHWPAADVRFFRLGCDKSVTVKVSPSN